MRKRAHLPRSRRKRNVCFSLRKKAVNRREWLDVVGHPLKKTRMKEPTSAKRPNKRGFVEMFGREEGIEFSSSHCI